MRFIPARAGNSQLPHSPFPRSTVHPRACGELLFDSSRAGGMSGSSPRVRGTPHRSDLPPSGTRFIPARAGNSQVDLRDIPAQTVHPRACGELKPCPQSGNLRIGSSPRVRGTRLDGDGCRSLCRFIPARAGNSVPPGRWRPLQAVHPRACGELVEQVRKPIALYGSSPRVRGTRSG